MFDPLKTMIAIRRGVAMNVDLNGGWDYWPVMGEQVEELRRRYHILPGRGISACKTENNRGCGLNKQCGHEEFVIGGIINS